MGKEKRIARIIGATSLAALVGIVAVGDEAENLDLQASVCQDFNQPLVQSGSLVEYSERDLAMKRFNQIIDFLVSCDLPQFRYAAGRFSILKQTDYLVVGEPALYVPDPAEIQLHYGEMDGSSVYKIHISQDDLVNDHYQRVDFSIYLLRALRMFEEVSWIDGSAADKTYIDRRNLEARAWIDTLRVTQVFENQVVDPTIKLAFEKYRELGEEGFMKYWERSVALEHLPWIYR